MKSDDKPLAELLDEVFDVMDGACNASYIAIARMLLAVALDRAKPKDRNMASEYIRDIVEELIDSRRVH